MNKKRIFQKNNKFFGKKKFCSKVVNLGIIAIFIISAFNLAVGLKIESSNKIETDPNVYKNDGDLTITKHRITPFELNELKTQIGICYDLNENYNKIIGGHGTGLRPPSLSDWENMAQDLFIVDDMSLSSSTNDELLDGAPISVDNSLDVWFPPIGTQDGEGSCVAWAVGYYTKTYQEAKEHNWDLSSVSWTGGYYGHPDSSQDNIFSPDFIYHQINNGEDEGAYFSDAFNLIERIGACTWNKMPYDPNDSTTWPSEDAYRQAPLYRAATEYNYMDTTTDSYLENLKNYLADDHLSVISINAGFYGSLLNNPDGDLWTVDNYNPTDTNHANTIVGYDDNFGPYTEEGNTRYGAFKVANSWLTGWSGDHDNDGFLWISYEAMKRRIEYCMFFDDFIGYEPKLISVFQIDHSKRGECDVTVGIGSISSPTITKQFNPQYWGDGYWSRGAIPFPSNKIILDITEFSDSVTTPVGENFFLDIYDTSTSATGTIVHFSIEYYSDYAANNLITAGTSTDPPVNTEQFNNVYAQTTLFAYFHTLNVIIDGSGSVSKDPDLTSYAEGSVVELTAIPDSGYAFSHWTDDLSSSFNPETITMDADKTVTAVFTEVTDQLDQSQPVHDYDFTMYGSTYWAQSFKPTLDTLTRVELNVTRSGSPPSDLVVSIQEDNGDDPSGSDLTSVSVPAGDIPTSSEWVSFDLPDISVTPGSTYHIVMHTSGGDHYNSYKLGFAIGDPYADGSSRRSSNAGSSWTEYTPYDFCFKTYG